MSKDSHISWVSVQDDLPEDYERVAVKSERQELNLL